MGEAARAGGCECDLPRDLARARALTSISALICRQCSASPTARSAGVSRETAGMYDRSGIAARMPRRCAAVAKASRSACSARRGTSRAPTPRDILIASLHTRAVSAGVTDGAIAESARCNCETGNEPSARPSTASKTSRQRE
jgi:hypothetical protein